MFDPSVIVEEIAKGSVRQWFSRRRGPRKDPPEDRLKQLCPLLYGCTLDTSGQGRIVRGIWNSQLDGDTLRVHVKTRNGQDVLEYDGTGSLEGDQILAFDLRCSVNNERATFLFNVPYSWWTHDDRCKPGPMVGRFLGLDRDDQPISQLYALSYKRLWLRDVTQLLGS